MLRRGLPGGGGKAPTRPGEAGEGQTLRPWLAQGSGESGRNLGPRFGLFAHAVGASLNGKMPESLWYMPARNVKRVFNRLFMVATVAWALYCNVIFPARKASEGLKRADYIYRAKLNFCHESAIRGNNTADLDACQKSAEDAWDYRQRQYSMKRMYAAYWPFILVASLGLPLLAYGAARGIAAVCLWVWKG